MAAVVHLVSVVHVIHLNVVGVLPRPFPHTTPTRLRMMLPVLPVVFCTFLPVLALIVSLVVSLIVPLIVIVAPVLVRVLIRASVFLSVLVVVLSARVSSRTKS